MKEPMDAFKYTSPGELFYPRASNFHKRPGMSYRRFATAAEALRFAIEGMPPPILQGCYIEVEGERYHSGQMREFYDSTDYPLARLRDTS